MNIPRWISHYNTEFSQNGHIKRAQIALILTNETKIVKPYQFIFFLKITIEPIEADNFATILCLTIGN